MNSMTIRFLLNGEQVEAQADPRIHAIDFLREQFELSSPRVGCEHGVCGACTIRVDGQIIRGCLMLSMQLDGTTVDRSSSRYSEYTGSCDASCQNPCSRA